MTEHVVEMDPRVDPRWQELVMEARSDVFHSPQWLRVLGDTYGFPLTARVIIDENNRPRGGLVFTEIHDHMDPRAVSLPFSDFCDPLVSDLNDWSLLTEGLVGNGRRFHMKCLHNQVPLQDVRLEESGRLMWHAVDTARSPDDVWSSLDGSARRAIRKAEASGIRVRPADSIEDVRSFFDLHLQVRKQKYGLLAQPFLFFERIWSYLVEPGSGQLLLAVLDDKVVGGVMFLQWKDTFYYKFNASDVNLLSVRPNDLVVWTGINEAHERGLAWLDFGVSDLDQEGLIRYKRKYASREAEVVALRSLPDGGPSPRERVARQMLGELTELLVAEDVSNQVTERAGDTLYQYFT